MNSLKVNKVAINNTPFRTIDYHNISEQTGIQIDVIQKIVNFFNKKNGKLNRDDFADLYSTLNVDELDDLDERQISDFVFRALDINHHGFITLKEFLFGISIQSYGTIKKKVEYTFSLYDTDNNGWLTKDEIKACFMEMFDIFELNADTVDEFVEEIVVKLDTQKCGKISKEQFVKALLKNRKLRESLVLF